jgi:hypothetical protein
VDETRTLTDDDIQTLTKGESDPSVADTDEDDVDTDTDDSDADSDLDDPS